MSQEYILAIAVTIVGVLQLFGIVVEQSAIVGIISGVAGIWIAIRRFKRGDITVLGSRK